MPLENFGSILNFAESIESQDQEFYALAAGNPACIAFKKIFEELAAEAAKNVKTIQRIRREQITEMILEPIRDFTRASFCEACEGAAVLSSSEILRIAIRLETRGERYYREAAEKIKALSEVSRALKVLGKIRKARLTKISSLK
jgi:rubrerythrin